MINSKILQEIQSVPQEYLADLYELIRNFRLQHQPAQKRDLRQPGLLKGQLGDAFFEPLSEEELQEWE